jgi:co-chaperonin GroES (HSP10)
MQLSDDYILLEEIKPPETRVQLINEKEIRPSVVKAKVLAVGPGEPNIAGGRNEMPCTSGDTVLVHSGAGLHYTETGKDFWFVYAARKDVIAVVNE